MQTKSKAQKIALKLAADIRTLQWTSQKPPVMGQLLTDQKTGQIFKVMDIQVTLLRIN